MITKISALNFRKFDEVDFHFKKPLVIFFGDKKSGKTTILEMVYFLSLHESLISKDVNEIIQNKKKHVYVSVEYHNQDLISANIKKEIKQYLLNEQNISRKEILNYYYPFYVNQKILDGFFNEKSKQEIINTFISMDKKLYSPLIKDFNKLLKTLQETKEIENYHWAIRNSIIERLIKIEKELMIFRSGFVEKLNFFFLENSKLYLKQKISLKYLPKFSSEKAIKEGLEKSDIASILNDQFVFVNDKDHQIYGLSSEKEKLLFMVLVISFLEFMKSEYQQEFPLLLDNCFQEFSKEQTSLIFELFKDKKINVLMTAENLGTLKIEYLKDVQIVKL